MNGMIERWGQRREGKMGTKKKQKHLKRQRARYIKRCKKIWWQCWQLRTRSLIIVGEGRGGGGGGGGALENFGCVVIIFNIYLIPSPSPPLPSPPLTDLSPVTRRQFSIIPSVSKLLAIGDDWPHYVPPVNHVIPPNSTPPLPLSRRLIIKRWHASLSSTL